MAGLPVELGAYCELSSGDSRHLINVLRLGLGAEIIVVFSDAHSAFRAVVAETHPTVKVRLVRVEAHSAPPSPVAVLIAPLLKGERGDWLCEKATELGVEDLIFFQADRSVVRLTEASDVTRKESRYLKIAEAAAKQSRRLALPKISCLSSTKAALDLVEAQYRSHMKIICSLGPHAKELRSSTFDKRRIVIASGPEGDFSPDEEHLFASSGFLPITLGDQILRAETAAITAVAVASALWNNRTYEMS